MGWRRLPRRRSPWDFWKRYDLGCDATRHGILMQFYSLTQRIDSVAVQANEAMCRPIRALTEAKGFECSAHILACFGGAGGQHCCAIARQLGIEEVFVHRYSSVLSGKSRILICSFSPCAKRLA